MSIVVNIKPGVEAELSRLAAAQGVEIGDYAASLLEKAAYAGESPKKLNQEQLAKTLKELAQFSHKIPCFPMRLSRARVFTGTMTDGKDALIQII